MAKSQRNLNISSDRLQKTSSYEYILFSSWNERRQQIKNKEKFCINQAQARVLAGRNRVAEKEKVAIFQQQNKFMCLHLQKQQQWKIKKT